MNPLALDVHAGHNHGFFGELVEGLIEKLPLSEAMLECLSHIVVDTLSVFFLLFVVMLAVFFLTGYVDVSKLHKRLGSLKSIWGFGLALLLGMLSPFCSCSVIPILMGFLSIGVPVSVCLCFLTASSMLNITALLSLSATAGLRFMLIYVACSLAIIAVSSIILYFLKLDNTIGHYHAHHHHDEAKTEKPTLKKRIGSAFSCTLDVFRRSWIFIVLGVVLSSVIMTYFSIDTLSAMINDNSILSTAIASLIGIPIHSDIFSIAPIITLLIELSPGLAIAFCISTMVISLPSIIILSRALKPKTVLSYCGIIIALTLLVGYIIVLIL